jgi:hypothetical protein
MDAGGLWRFGLGGPGRAAGMAAEADYGDSAKFSGEIAFCLSYSLFHMKRIRLWRRLSLYHAISC